jgi:ferredoxin-NADP reductase
MIKMKQYNVKVNSVEKVTRNVLQIRTEKPADINFIPGQATEISINKEGWKDKTRPFTFTSLPEEDHLEFNIKTYPERKGVTNELLNLSPGEELILHDVFGDIQYKGEGVFIAGGAGVTPFISIFRSLHSKNIIGDNKLIFANKTKEDIILEFEFREMLGNNFINVLSEENDNLSRNYEHGHINEDLLRKHYQSGSYIYLCGPPPMMDAMEILLQNLQIAEKLIVKEGF